MKRCFFLILFVFLTCFSFYTGRVLGAPAIPDPTVKCKEEEFEDPEFNSLRPYQASPCREAPFASMCGNNIKVTIDQVECDYEGEETCEYTDDDRRPTTKTVVIDLSNVKLPILSNTQDVANSVTGTDGFDDAQKMNEYVAWYLSGASQKAEYGADSIDKLINFSGPSKKLLPSVAQELFRFKQLHDAGTKSEVSIDSDDNATTAEVKVDETGNHNQIAVCTTKNVLGINNPWIGEEIPTPCYDGNGNKANGKKYRLVDWWEGKLSAYNTIFNILVGWTGNMAWNARTPPFPWQFDKDIYYQKAYQEWRGKQCNIILGKLLCVDVPGIATNRWADFYQYIPLSNSVDKKGKESFSNATIRGQFAQITKSETSVKRVPKLFYPQTIGVSEAVVNLNKTFLPIEGVESGSIPELTEDNTSTCQILDVRTNQGDDLTFDNTKSKHQIEFDVTYEVGEIKCREAGTITKNPCLDPKTGYKIPGCYATPYQITEYVCNSDITAEFDLRTLAPHLTDIWENTTAGAGSTFRKIFPKVMEGAPVSCIADIPGVSSATYNLNDASSDSVGNLVVKNPPSATNTSPEIYFPHLGSVYEYFLKGIQTALRPQGYGEPITNGTQCITEEVLTECPVNVPDSNVPSKYLGGFKSNFISLADRWSGRCPGPENNMAEECYNYVASESQKAGVNPGFALTIWLNESGASNYCEGGETTQDMGINISSLYQNLVGQLPIFFNMAKQQLCSGVAGYVEPMHGWLSRYQSSRGVCDPSDSVATQYYYNVMNTTWTWVTGCASGGRFGITWPTDMRCP